MRLLAPHRPRVIRMDMTPMIDVVLQLIIFFMFTSQFGELVRSRVDLPAAAGDRSTSTLPPDLVVDIEADGTLRMGGVAVRLDDAVAEARRLRALAEHDAALRVVLRADRNAPARVLDGLTRALAAVGVRSCSLATTDEPST